MQNVVWRRTASLQCSGGREQAAGGHRECLYVVGGGAFKYSKKNKQGDIKDCSLQQDKMDENPTTKMKYSPSPKENCGITESIDHRL